MRRTKGYHGRVVESVTLERRSMMSSMKSSLRCSLKRSLRRSLKSSLSCVGTVTLGVMPWSVQRGVQ